MNNTAIPVEKVQFQGDTYYRFTEDYLSREVGSLYFSVLYYPSQVDEDVSTLIEDTDAGIKSFALIAGEDVIRLGRRLGGTSEIEVVQ